MNLLYVKSHEGWLHFAWRSSVSQFTEDLAHVKEQCRRKRVPLWWHHGNGSWRIEDDEGGRGRRALCEIFANGEKMLAPLDPMGEES